MFSCTAQLCLRLINDKTEQQVQERLKLVSNPAHEKPAYTTTNNVVEDSSQTMTDEVRLQ